MNQIRKITTGYLEITTGYLEITTGYFGNHDRLFISDELLRQCFTHMYAQEPFKSIKKAGFYSRQYGLVILHSRISSVVAEVREVPVVITCRDFKITCRDP
jgi:hypothetical protein